MALQAASGNYGEVIAGGSVIGEISAWKATIDRGGKGYGAQSGVDASGHNWEKTLLGTGKCTGSFDGFFDPNFPVGSIVDTDALITLTLYLVKPGLSAGPSSYMTGSARIFSRDISADIATGDPEPFSTNFQYNGKPTFNNM